MDTLYFAYGSNMSRLKMEKFAPDATVVTIGWLQDWYFCLRHRWHDGSAKATVIPRKGSIVWGVLYRVSAEA
jgi:gamma-glutamylcyclotransferase